MNDRQRGASYEIYKNAGGRDDFIVLDNRSGEIRENEYSALAVCLCRRRLSIGADGLMIVLPAQGIGDYAMRFYNSDGSLGEMCGNGARCIARYGYDRGLAGDIQRIETTAGIVVGQRIEEDLYCVRLNDPTFTETEIGHSVGRAGFSRYRIWSSAIPVSRTPFWSCRNGTRCRRTSCARLVLISAAMPHSRRARM